MQSRKDRQFVEYVDKYGNIIRDPLGGQPSLSAAKRGEAEWWKKHSGLMPEKDDDIPEENVCYLNNLHETVKMYLQHWHANRLTEKVFEYHMVRLSKKRYKTIGQDMVTLTPDQC